MSFSQEVKEELIDVYTKAAHCQKAQALALKIFDSKNVEEDPAAGTTIYHFTSRIKTFTINLNCAETPEKVTEKTCCKRAFLRGAFLAAGTISDPEKEYRFDIICTDRETAEFLQNLMSEFDLSAKVAKRRERYIVYLKEGEQIADILNVMQAHNAMMRFENIRILKEMRGFVNRQVNCETANIHKTVSAAMKQMEDIRLIQETGKENLLDANLSAVAKVRMQYPDATLQELGEHLNPPVSKSAINHRMRKIGEIAEEIRRQAQESHPVNAEI